MSTNYSVDLLNILKSCDPEGYLKFQKGTQTKVGTRKEGFKNNFRVFVSVVTTFVITPNS